MGVRDQAASEKRISEGGGELGRSTRAAEELCWTSNSVLQPASARLPLLPKEARIPRIALGHSDMDGAFGLHAAHHVDGAQRAECCLPAPTLTRPSATSRIIPARSPTLHRWLRPVTEWSRPTRAGEARHGGPSTALQHRIWVRLASNASAAERVDSINPFSPRRRQQTLERRPNCALAVPDQRPR